MTEPKLINSSPEKIQDKMEIEKKWALNILDKYPNDFNDKFLEQLSKFDNAIQIWIKGQVLSNANISASKTYLEKAKELGYSTSHINEAVKITSFNDGTFVFSTKDKTIADKIKSYVNESLKQTFQYDEDKLGSWSWNMFQNTQDLHVTKSEYKPDALISLINNDNFLKFTYHNLMSGDLNKDLHMMYNNYVKDDVAYSKAIKTYESHVTYIERTHAIKFSFYNKLSELCKEASILEKIDINEVSFIVDKLNKLNIFENFDSLTKVETKNILSDLKIKGIIEKLNTSKLTFDEINENLSNTKIAKLFNISENSSILINTYLTNILKESIKYYNIGKTEYTSLFNILTSICLTNELK